MLKSSDSGFVCHVLVGQSDVQYFRNLELYLEVYLKFSKYYFQCT